LQSGGPFTHSGVEPEGWPSGLKAAVLKFGHRHAAQCRGVPVSQRFWG
jgi:hypothetical protein